VPVSTQWDVNGYYYPIQIAQFGLSHYSKYVLEGEPSRIIIEDVDNVHSGNWKAKRPSDITVAFNPDRNSDKVIEISQTKGGRRENFST
jgi:heparosan-N-sulfate-glucuronate 5-epimerase